MQIISLADFLRIFPSSQGHEGKFSVYIHASKETPVHYSRYFVNREIRSDEVCLLFILF